jgi:hypothetical protein
MWKLVFAVLVYAFNAINTPNKLVLFAAAFTLNGPTKSAKYIKPLVL